MLSKEGKLKYIIETAKKMDISGYEIAKNSELTESGVNRILNGSTKNPHINTVNSIYNYVLKKMVTTAPGKHEEIEYNLSEETKTLNEPPSKISKAIDSTENLELKYRKLLEETVENQRAVIVDLTKESLFFQEEAAKWEKMYNELKEEKK